MYEIGGTHVLTNLEGGFEGGTLTKIYCLNGGETQKFYIEIENPTKPTVLFELLGPGLEEYSEVAEDVKQLPELPIAGQARC
ncbi:MAG: hypothetical protein GY915_03160 [bacterium]|nr:hypothetical protein [bacterium]